nr:hypothetical protein [Solirubrobacterales bacterium]
MTPLATIDPHVAGAPNRLLLRVARDGGAWVALLAFACVAVAAAEIALPAIIGRAVDALVAEGSAGIWAVWCGALLAVLVAADALDDLASGCAVARSTARLR